MLPRYGMIHGRFQPFHNGHWQYARAALARCDVLIIGITLIRRSTKGKANRSNRNFASW